MLSLRLVLRALRWRLGASLTVFAVGLIGIVAAAVGPIYLNAVDQTLLSSRLVQAPATHLDLHIVQQTTIGLPGYDWHHATQVLAARPDPHLFSAPVYSQDAPIQWQAPQPTESDLVSLDHVCDHVRVVSGTCLSSRGSGSDALVTRRIALAHHLAVGDRVVTRSPGSADHVTIRIVGVVAPIDRNGAFWSPWPYLITSTDDLGNAPVRSDAFFVSRSLLDTHLDDLEQTVAANLRLRVGHVGLGDLPRLHSQLDQLRTAAARIPTPAQTSVPVVESSLPSVVDTIRGEMSLSRTLVVLTSAQLVVLAVILLYQAVAGVASASEAEVALARLRGRRTRRVLVQALGPSVSLVALAAPIAGLVAWLAVRLVAPHIMGSGTVVGFPSSAVFVIVAAAAASVAAAIAAARRVVLAPVGQLLRRGAPNSRTSTALILLDTVTVVLGVAGVVEIETTRRLGTGSVNPLSAIAVVMLAAAAGVLVVRVLPLLLRLVIRGTGESPRAAPFLALRQIARRPSGSRVVIALAVAVALAGFGAAVWSSAAHNRRDRALEQAGAQTVYFVRARPGVDDLRSAVDRADPDGNSMAAELVQLARTTPVLAVDTTRFAGVATWATNDSTTPLRTALARLRDVPASVVVDQRVLRFSVRLVAQPLHATTSLTVMTTGRDHLTSTITSGPLHFGSNTVTQLLTCARPCRITGLSLHAKPQARHRLGNASILASLRASSANSTSATSWRPVAGFTSVARWRRDGSAGRFNLDDSTAGLTLRTQYDTVDSDWPGIASADVPDVIPAVVAPETASLYNSTSVHSIAAFGLDDSPLTFDGRTRVVSLPMLDRNGVMIDLGVALNAMQSAATPQTQLLVFANGNAPGDLPVRLRRQGVTVTRTVHASSFADQLGHTGPAYADALFLVAAILGAVLAVAVAVLAAATEARRRAREFAALRTVGLTARTLRAAIAFEQLFLLGVGLVVGFVAGLVGARLALPKTPVFVNENVGPPIDSHVPLLAPVVLAIALAVALGITAALVATAVSRQASADRLGDTA